MTWSFTFSSLMLVKGCSFRSITTEVAVAVVLVAPLRLDAVGLNATLHQTLPVVNEGTLGAGPVARRTAPQTFSQGGPARPQLMTELIHL